MSFRLSTAYTNLALAVTILENLLNGKPQPRSEILAVIEMAKQDLTVVKKPRLRPPLQADQVAAGEVSLAELSEMTSYTPSAVRVLLRAQGVVVLRMVQNNSVYMRTRALTALSEQLASMNKDISPTSPLYQRRAAVRVRLQQELTK